MPAELVQSFAGAWLASSGITNLCSMHASSCRVHFERWGLVVHIATSHDHVGCSKGALSWWIHLEEGNALAGPWYDILLWREWKFNI